MTSGKLTWEDKAVCLLCVLLFIPKLRSDDFYELPNWVGFVPFLQYLIYRILFYKKCEKIHSLGVIFLTVISIGVFLYLDLYFGSYFMRWDERGYTFWFVWRMQIYFLAIMLVYCAAIILKRAANSKGKSG